MLNDFYRYNSSAAKVASLVYTEEHNNKKNFHSPAMNFLIEKERVELPY